MSRKFAEEFIQDFRKKNKEEQINTLKKYGIEVANEDLNNKKTSVTIPVKVIKEFRPELVINCNEKKNLALQNMSYYGSAAYRAKCGRSITRARVHKQG